jgi:cytochrome o ubiquinol oxidase subunit 1
MVFYMWWLAALAFVGIFAVSIWHSFDYDRDYYIPAEEVARSEREQLSYLDTGYLPPPARKALDALDPAKASA